MVDFVSQCVWRVAFVTFFMCALQIKGSFTSKRGQESFNPYSKGSIFKNCMQVLCGPTPPRYESWMFFLHPPFVLVLHDMFPNSFGLEQIMYKFCTYIKGKMFNRIYCYYSFLSICILLMYLMSHVHPASLQKLLRWTLHASCSTKIFFMYAMFIGTIDFYHFIPLLLPFTLRRGHKVRAKQSLLASFCGTIFILSAWIMMLW